MHTIPFQSRLSIESGHGLPSAYPCRRISKISKVSKGYPIGLLSALIRFLPNRLSTDNADRDVDVREVLITRTRPACRSSQRVARRLIVIH